MRLHVIYRSYGGENRKDRPDYYSKMLSLASLVRAVEEVRVPTEVLFLNDGPIPDNRMAVMTSVGEVVEISGGSNRASYRHAITLPRLRGWDDDDLVWLSEDDYLYKAGALAAATEAATLPYADYVALYSSLRFGADARRSAPTFSASSRAEGDQDAVQLAGLRWYRAVGTTSTFGGRVKVLRADERLLRLSPYVGGSWDTATCLAYQGFRPFGLRELAGDPRPPEQPLLKRAARHVGLVGIRSAYDVAALARPQSRLRTLVAPDPEPVTHLETAFLAPGTDWAAEAEDVRRWAATRGLDVPAPVPAAPDVPVATLRP